MFKTVEGIIGLCTVLSPNDVGVNVFGRFYKRS